MANNNLSLRSLLENEKLNGINFLDWFRNLRIVLKQERKEYVIEEPVPDEPAANAPSADKDKFKKYMDDMLDVSCLMLATMSPELQKQHEDMNVYDMIQNLKEIYEGQARQESMNEINKTLPQLLGMLRTAESDLKKNRSKSILMEPLKRRIMAKRNVDLRAGNGARVATLAIGTDISLIDLI
ncbi:hypothetical protein V6N11_047310 [Hibiscus sabdariffa]|uniref:Zinc finger, CCHC-type n=1 Tax=Hibiscus sabdariffa TaxID=183260 RepID=A0ABR2PBY4_9ROSI